MKKLSFVLAILLLLNVCIVSCSNKKDQGNTPDTTPTECNHVWVEGSCKECGKIASSYTYSIAKEVLGTSWNPHTAQSEADKLLAGYVTFPLVDVSVDTTGNGGVYQRVFEMATSVTNVTSKGGQSTSGYVYEIKLNPEAYWENGEKITADSYIKSMYWLLHPKMQNAQASLYYEGEFAIAGADTFYYQGGTLWVDSYGEYAIADLVKSSDGTYTTADGTPLMIATTTPLDWLYGYTLGNYVDAYGDYMFDISSYAALVAACDDNGNAPLTDENLALLVNVITYSVDWGESATDACNYLVCGVAYPEVDFDSTVGLYKVDDYTLHYVCQNSVDLNSFLEHLRTNWLIYEPLYVDNMDKTGDVWTTSYGTSKETTMSYGPYKMESFQDAKQVVYIQNENWYGYEKATDGTPKRDATGNLVSYTSFLVDGEKQPQFTTTKIKIDVMTAEQMKNAYLAGELSEWSPSYDEISNYTSTEQMLQVDEPYTLSLLFNTGTNILEYLDSIGKNTNSAVLSSNKFRKALSLAMDRSELAKATAGYKPAFTLINSVFYSDLINDPTSSYRYSDAAKNAISSLYGGNTYESITGYDLVEAKKLMKEACDELTSAGLYKEGAPIKIQIAWAKGDLTAYDNKQIELINKFVSEAADGSGFGEIILEAVGNVPNRYSAILYGEYAVCYGAWGGEDYGLFDMIRLYCDTVDNYASALGEVYFWNPATDKLTIKVDGKDVTMTWAEWARACTTGAYANADLSTKVQITATLEKELLDMYYFIPICSSTNVFLVSSQLNYYTSEYNVMYGFGGMRLIKYNYDDAAWNTAK